MDESPCDIRTSFLLFMACTVDLDIHFGIGSFDGGVTFLAVSRIAELKELINVRNITAEKREGSVVEFKLKRIGDGFSRMKPYNFQI